MTAGNYDTREKQVMPEDYRRNPAFCSPLPAERGDIFLRTNYAAVKQLGDLYPTRWADMSTGELIDAAKRHLANVKFNALRVNDRHTAIAALIAVRG